MESNPPALVESELALALALVSASVAVLTLCAAALLAAAAPETLDAADAAAAPAFDTDCCGASRFTAFGSAPSSTSRLLCTLILTGSVLGNVSQGNKTSSAQTPEALRTALRARYFADYAEHWQSFMNSLRCDSATTLPAAISQLKLIADARQSPLIALMKALDYQGGAGAQRDSLSDTLVNKAQNILGKKDDAPQAAKPDPAGPLGSTFGPVLRLVAQSNANVSASARSDLSLERFTERITSLRLKLQQISDSPDSDEQARQVAQSLLLGKGSDLADTLAYAQLIAASLGEQWAGMGAELFVRPVSQATQTVLEPAQASLNDAWNDTIVANWNRSFAGRYPFASTVNDASLPELARFLRPQGGLIDTFLATQLAGVIQLQGDQWVPVPAATGTSSAARAVDPAFLKAINTLQRIAAHLLAQGEPSYRFELKPVPTPGISSPPRTSCCARARARALPSRCRRTPSTLA